jgi:hypothetical protein
MEDKNFERKEMLKKKGYFTVNDLIQKLQELKEKGFGNELVGSDLEHYQYCEFDPVMGYVIVE